MVYLINFKPAFMDKRISVPRDSKKEMEMYVGMRDLDGTLKKKSYDKRRFKVKVFTNKQWEKRIARLKKKNELPF